MSRRFLAVAVRLLPSSRREWGTAMLAEHSAISSALGRWSFAVGCARVVLTRPGVWHRLGYPALGASAVLAVLVGTRDVADAPMHWGLVGVVLVLVLISWLGRTYLPVQPTAVSRIVRVFGYLLVGTLAGSLVVSLVDKTDVAALPMLAVLFSLCLTGFLSHTAFADRRTLLSGSLLGVAAAAAWTASAVAFAPVPASPSLAVFLCLVSSGVAVAFARSLRAAALAGTASALLIFFAVGVLSSFGPAWLIPDLTPHALPADRVSESRIELVDPYVWMLLVAALSSLPSVLGRRTRSASGPSGSRLLGWRTE